jgi:hypothetical protein
MSFCDGENCIKKENCKRYIELYQKGFFPDGCMISMIMADKNCTMQVKINKEEDYVS